MINSTLVLIFSSCCYVSQKKIRDEGEGLSNRAKGFFQLTETFPTSLFLAASMSNNNNGLSTVVVNK